MIVVKRDGAFYRWRFDYRGYRSRGVALTKSKAHEQILERKSALDELLDQ